MSERYEAAEVPFAIYGNHAVLTDQQIAEAPWLREFLERFKLCFEYDVTLCAWFYTPPTGENDGR